MVRSVTVLVRQPFRATGPHAQTRVPALRQAYHRCVPDQPAPEHIPPPCEGRRGRSPTEVEQMTAEFEKELTLPSEAKIICALYACCRHNALTCGCRWSDEGYCETHARRCPVCEEPI